MTEEREKTDSVGETDALVTRTYRDVANERTPDHLNQAVLKEAASAVRPRYSRFINWTRPMAWAATVTLCVALVLEVTRAPVPQSIAPVDNVTRSESVPQELDVADDVPATGRPGGTPEAETPVYEVLEKTVAPTTQPERASNIAASKKAQTKETRANEASPKLSLRSRADGKLSQEEQLAAPKPSSADEFRVKDADMLIKAEEMARTQTGDSIEASQSFDAALVSGTAGHADTNATCDESGRSTPESWLACIEELEEAGRPDEARRQRELLQEVFPDFDAR